MRTFLANHLPGMIFGFMHIMVLMIVATVIGIVPALIVAVIAAGLAFGTIALNWSLATR